MSAAFHEILLAAARDEWEAMQAHRFVTDIEADRLPAAVFRRYLCFERDFVETALLIFGHALVKAPGLAERRWLAGVLHALADEQLAYFDAVLGPAEAELAPVGSPPAVTAFREGMLAIAIEGTYAEIIAAMLAAEWMYATWCVRAAAGRLSDPALRRWVGLHAEPAFLAQVAWLKAQIDALAAGMDTEARDRARACFRLALTLEIGFHASAYPDPGG